MDNAFIRSLRSYSIAAENQKNKKPVPNPYAEKGSNKQTKSRWRTPPPNKNNKVMAVPPNSSLRASYDQSSTRNSTPKVSKGSTKKNMSPGKCFNILKEQTSFPNLEKSFVFSSFNDEVKSCTNFKTAATSSSFTNSSFFYKPEDSFLSAIISTEKEEKPECSKGLTDNLSTKLAAQFSLDFSVLGSNDQGKNAQENCFSTARKSPRSKFGLSEKKNLLSEERMLLKSRKKSIGKDQFNNDWETKMAKSLEEMKTKLTSDEKCRSKSRRDALLLSAEKSNKREGLDSPFSFQKNDINLVETEDQCKITPKLNCEQETEGNSVNKILLFGDKAREKESTENTPAACFSQSGTFEENESKIDVIKNQFFKEAASPSKRIIKFKDNFLTLIDELEFITLSEAQKSEVADLVCDALNIPKRKKKSIIKLDDNLLGECEKILLKSKEDREEKEKSFMLGEKEEPHQISEPLNNKKRSFSILNAEKDCKSDKTRKNVLAADSKVMKPAAIGKDIKKKLKK